MNQNQITMTAGDERTLAFVIIDAYEGDTATLVVDGQFTKTVTVGEDDGSGYATATFTITEDDTSDLRPRRAYRYSLRVDDEGATKTVRRGLLVVVPELDDVDA